MFNGCALRSASLEVIAYYLRRTAYKEQSHGKSAVFLPSNDTLGPWGYGLLDFDLPGSIESTPEFPHNEIHLSHSKMTSKEFVLDQRGCGDESCHRPCIFCDFVEGTASLPKANHYLGRFRGRCPNFKGSSIF